MQHLEYAWRVTRIVVRYAFYVWCLLVVLLPIFILICFLLNALLFAPTHSQTEELLVFPEVAE